MDPRVVPEEFLGPKPMLAAFRNAGGRCTPDVIRTLAVLRSLTPNAKQATVMVVHHTGKHTIFIGIGCRKLISIVRLWHDSPDE